MIQPEKDPHWLLGVEHGREGREPYAFGDGENQRRYVRGYEKGTAERAGMIRTPPTVFDGWRQAHHEP